MIRNTTFCLLGLLCSFAFTHGYRLDPVGTWGTGRYQHVSFFGGYVFCSAGSAGLDILDRYNDLQAIGHLDADYAAAALWDDETGYLIDGGLGLVTFTIDDEGQLVRLGSFDWGHRFVDTDIAIAFANGYLFVAGESMGIWRFDVDDRENPVGTMMIGNLVYSFRDVSVLGNRIAALTHDSLLFFEMSATETMLPVVEVPGNFADLAEYSNVLAVSGEDQLLVYTRDVQTGLVEETTLPLPGARQVAVGFREIVATTDQGLAVYDLSNPEAPVLRQGAIEDHEAVSLAVEGNAIGLANRDGGLSLYNFQGPEPELSGRYDRSGIAGEVAFWGMTGYLNHYASIEILDTTDPAAPVRIGRIPLQEHARDIQVDSGRLYICEAFVGLHIYDITDPANPVWLSTFPGDPDVILARGSSGHLADGALYELDLSDPSNPEIISGTAKAKNHSRYIYLARSGDYLFRADTHSLAVVDYGTPGFPEHIAYIDVPTGPMAIDNDRLYVAGEDALSAIDIADPTTPAVIGETPLARRPGHLAVGGRFAFASYGFAGVEIYDIATAEAPRLFGFHQGTDPRAVTIARGRAFVAEGDSGMLATYLPVRLEQTAVIPWVVANEGFSSRVSLFNDGEETIGINLRAVSNAGARQERMVILQGGAVFAAESDDLFAGLSGYSLTVESPDPRVFTSTLLFNLEAVSGGRSPAQTNALTSSSLGSGLVFPCVSGSDTAALVITAPRATGETVVHLTMNDGYGRDWRQATVTLQGPQPVAALVAELFDEMPEHASVRAVSTNGETLAGINFTFNQLRQPSMAAAVPVP